MKRTKSTARSTTSPTLKMMVETPRGSRNKYAYNQETGRIKLSKVIAEGMVFPYDFGFIPGTKADDGDPLDVLVLTDEPTFPGCEVDCRLLGVIKATQAEEGRVDRNDRLIAVAEQSLEYGEVKDLSDLDPALVRRMEAFFFNYQKLRNVEFKVLGRAGVETALQILENARTKRAA